VAALEKQLRNELEWITLKALRKDPDERYQTATEFAADVSNYLEQRPLLAGPHSARYRVKAFLRKNKGTVAVASALTITIVLGAAFSTIGFMRANRERAVAEQNALKARREAARADLEASNARQEAEKQAALNRLLTEMFETTNAIAAERAHQQPSKQDVALSLETMAALLYSQDRLAEAEFAWREVIKIYQETNAKAEDLAWAQMSLAKAFLREGKVTEAQLLFPELEMRCREILKQRQSDHASRPTTRTSVFATLPGAQALLGEVFLLQRKYKEAEGLLLSAYTGLEKLAPKRGAPYAGQIIVQLYDEWPNREQAAVWRQRLAVKRSTIAKPTGTGSFRVLAQAPRNSFDELNDRNRAEAEDLLDSLERLTVTPEKAAPPTSDPIR
jgi:hypothetical protein